jgi:periplasmic divalent cation tolerance protein
VLFLNKQNIIEGILVFSTASSKTEAVKIAEGLVDAKLAACVNIVSDIKSVFRWQGEICREGEALLIIKSIRDKYGLIEKKIKQLHSYDVPEIIAMPIIEGSKAYLKWVEKETLHNDHGNKIY